LRPTRTATCYVVSVVTGLMSSLGALLLTGIMSGEVAETLRREAWDTELYWLIGLPLCYLVAGALGWLGPERIWRWPLVMMGTQALAMLLLSGSGLSLLPLGLILFAILALPGILTAWIGRCMRRFKDAMAAS
jgi:hypothetical protein